MANIYDDIVQKILESGSLLGFKKEDIQGFKITSNHNEKVTINCPTHAYNNSAGFYGTISIRDFF